jgi:hypothetical protein
MNVRLASRLSRVKGCVADEGQSPQLQSDKPSKLFEALREFQYSTADCRVAGLKE